MKNKPVDLVRYWKDPDYRGSLDAGQLEGLQHPSGIVQLEDAALDDIAGGATWYFGTLGCCGGWTSDYSICRTGQGCGGGGGSSGGR